MNGVSSEGLNDWIFNFSSYSFVLSKFFCDERMQINIEVLFKKKGGDRKLMCHEH